MMPAAANAPFTPMRQVPPAGGVYVTALEVFDPT